MAGDPGLGDRDKALVLDILLAAEDAISFVDGVNEKGFLESRLHQNAVIRPLEVIGEAAGKLSSEFRDLHGDIPWREITGMRHRLAHDYGGVRLDVVWRTAHERLPALIAALTPLVPRQT